MASVLRFREEGKQRCFHWVPRAIGGDPAFEPGVFDARHARVIAESSVARGDFVKIVIVEHGIACALGIEGPAHA